MRNTPGIGLRSIFSFRCIDLGIGVLSISPFTCTAGRLANLFLLHNSYPSIVCCTTKVSRYNSKDVSMAASSLPCSSRSPKVVYAIPKALPMSSKEGLNANSGAFSEFSVRKINKAKQPGSADETCRRPLRPLHPSW
jgi:hypothetical protein